VIKRTPSPHESSAKTSHLLAASELRAALAQSRSNRAIRRASAAACVLFGVRCADRVHETWYVDTRMLAADRTVTLEAMTRDDSTLVGNLLELYIHDLSAIFVDVELGADGRFGYPHLGSYLSGASDRFPFLIRCDGRVAGFILARRGSPVAEDPLVLDVAEYFVLRRFRGLGVGRSAAKLLWDNLRGAWTIRAAAVNPRAVAFWRSVVGTYTTNVATEAERSVGSKTWVVFSFDNGG
jgi:predicted acetyltransferase